MICSTFCSNLSPLSLHHVTLNFVHLLPIQILLVMISEVQLWNSKCNNALYRILCAVVHACLIVKCVCSFPTFHPYMLIQVTSAHSCVKNSGSTKKGVLFKVLFIMLCNLPDRL